MNAALGRLGSVRARTTILAVLVVGAALAIGALGLLDLLHTSLQEGVETTAEAQLYDVDSLLRLGHLPAELPGSRDGTFIQVVGSDGRVIATSATLLGARPISALRPGEDGSVIQTIPTLSKTTSPSVSEPGGPYLILARHLTELPVGSLPGQAVTVYVAGSLHPAQEATATVAGALSAGLPVLVALVGVLVWVFGGRALRPVEAIRAEVADITGHGLHRRVPEPSSSDEIARLARTMNEMLDRLEASAGTQRRFVADASHELRSPLAVLQATLELATTHPGEAAWPAAAASALDETRRLYRLVDDLLTLAQAEHDRQPSRAETVDLDEIVVRDARRRRAASPVRFDLARVSGGRVHGDPGQLARVVCNLLDNAERHAASTVTVELCAGADATVRLAVGDDGPGIPAAHRRQVFERFARLDEARHQGDGGSGLGLAIVAEIVTAHHGTVQVDDVPEGARLVVRLPALETGSSPQVKASPPGSDQPIRPADPTG
ncbi:MAG: sensor histidine kinase [Acidimicrobiales bacterium]